MPDFSIVLEKASQRKLNEKIMKENISEIIRRSLTGSRKQQGWTCDSWHVPQPAVENQEYVYSIKLNFKKKKPVNDSVDAEQFHYLTQMAAGACSGNGRWRVVSAGGTVIDQKTIAKLLVAKEIGKISLKESNHFARVFNRRAQINRIMGALELAQRTNFLKRTNSLLDGPAGCGKTEIMKSFSQMLGHENEAWLWFDAPAMTRAGITELFIKADVIPPVLFIEEIEKVDESVLRGLLSIMDTRGEVRRTNYRVGNESRDVRLVVIATANDVALLKSVMSGALYSRFQNKIYCPPPDRDIMRKILEREMTEIKGKIGWIEPCLKFGYDKWGITDPRDIITICSCGGDRLLDGNYQKDYEKTMHPLEKEELLQAKKYREEMEKKHQLLADD